MVSGQGNDEEGANVLNVSIWVEGAVLEYERGCVTKKQGGISATYRHNGGAPVCQYEGKSGVGICMREKFEGGRYTKKDDDVLSEGGEDVIIWRRRDAVLEI